MRTIELKFSNGDQRTREWLDEHPVEANRLFAANHGERPVCLCRDPGIPMYVARRGETYYLARLPNSGPLHALDCPSHGSDWGEEYTKSAVNETEEGIEITVPWLKAPAPKATRSPGKPGTSRPRDPAATPGAARHLSAVGLLSLLWESAEFTQWWPGMAGKRGYAQFRKFVGRAADSVIMNGVPLSERLVIVPPFKGQDQVDPDDAAANEALGTADGSDHLLGCVAATWTTPYSTAIRLWSMKEPIYIPKAEVRKVPGLKQAIDGAGEGGRIDVPPNHPGWVFLACVYRSKEKRHLVCKAAGLMAVSADWLPIRSEAERVLFDGLVKEGRGFRVVPKFDRQIPMIRASGVFTDTDDPVWIYIREEAEQRNLELRGADAKVWVWDRNVDASRWRNLPDALT